jgi:hypothetical protein
MLSLSKMRVLLLVLVCGSAAWAQESGTGCVTTRDGSTVCPKPDSQCKVNRYGDVICSTPGGGIEADRYGDLACGPGYCVKDQRGDIFCSSAARGAAAVDRYGNATCSEACVKAASASCVVLKSAR